jgi:hypothetical protein
MAKKIMLEVTQPVVNGNQVVHNPGELFELGSDLPEGVLVREVIADVPEPPKAEAKREPTAKSSSRP